MSREDHIQSIVLTLAKLQRPAHNRGWKHTGLSHAQVGMLFMLAYYRQNSVNETADFLGVSKSAVSQLIDPLETKRLVARVTDPKDRRIVRLNLTAKGGMLVKELAKHKLDGIRTAANKLTESELDQLYKLVLKMADK